MLVSIIIVNYNTNDITCNCIKSIIEHTHKVDYEIILVDNNSTKGDVGIFKKTFPAITFIQSEINGGFAYGNNLGIQYSKGDIILLLNSDTVLLEDSISIAAKNLVKIPDVGALTVHLTYEDGSYQHNARAFRSIRNELLDLVRPLILLLPYKRRACLMLNQYFKGDFSGYCDWVSGAFFMFKRAVLDQFPGQKLDERFFMYGEDELWCYQLTRLGYKSYFASETKLIHIANASSDKKKKLALLQTIIANELAIMKYRGFGGSYYYSFKYIFLAKEYIRYYLKIILGIKH